MGYPRNNNYNSQRGGYNHNNGYNSNQGFQPKQQTKKSGATYTKMRKGKYEGFTAVNAWRKTAQGLMTASAFPVSDVEHMSQKGNGFLRYAVDVVMNGQKTTYWCLYNTKSQKIPIKELSLVISPNGSGMTASGKRVTGFFGASFKRR